MSGDSASAEDVLRQRAHALKHRRAQVESQAQLELLLFELQGHRLGLRSRAVERVLSGPRVLRLPGASAVVPGVVLYRDEPIALVDVGVLFDAPPLERVNAVVVARGVAGTLALAAQELVGLVRVREAELVPHHGELTLRFVRHLTTDLLKVLDHDALSLDPRITGQSHTPSEDSP